MSQSTPRRHPIWNLRIPLKIKLFMWYLINNIALTKDNLAKKQWKGSLKCDACILDESIQHLFFDCSIARCVWRCVHVSFNIPPPRSIQHLFGQWMQGVDKNFKNKIWFGACILCWSIWLCRNDVIFNNAQVPTPMQVLFRGTYWMRQWAILLKEDDRSHVKMGCHLLEVTIMQIFANNGWSFSSRISF